MANINNVVLVGRMTKEAEVKQTEKSAIANFTIAVNYFDSRTKKEVPSFFDIKCFAHNANYIGKYGAKGAKVTIAGEARQERWEEQEGQKRSKIVFYANNIELDGKKDTEGSGSAQPKYDGSQGYAKEEGNPFEDNGTFTSDIPF
jgi:single-strand DNA-binding protein